MKMKKNIFLRFLFVLVIVLNDYLKVYSQGKYEIVGVNMICDISFSIVACLILTESLDLRERYKASCGIKKIAFFVFPFFIFLSLMIFFSI